MSLLAITPTQEELLADGHIYHLTIQPTMAPYLTSQQKSPDSLFTRLLNNLRTLMCS